MIFGFHGNTHLCCQLVRRLPPPQLRDVRVRIDLRREQWPVRVQPGRHLGRHVPGQVEEEGHDPGAAGGQQQGGVDLRQAGAGGGGLEERSNVHTRFINKEKTGRRIFFNFNF